MCKVICFTDCAVIKIFEKNMMFPLLLDIYGVLLNERKRGILDYYYNEDYSLSEISELTGISRQGVRDSIKKSEEEIYSLENKLGIVAKNRIMSEEIKDIISSLADIHLSGDDDVRREIDTIIIRLESLILSNNNETDIQE